MIQTLDTKVVNLMKLLLDKFLRWTFQDGLFLQQQVLQHISHALMTWKTPVQLSCPNSGAHGNFRSGRVMMSTHAFGKGHGPESK